MNGNGSRDGEKVRGTPSYKKKNDDEKQGRSQERPNVIKRKGLYVVRDGMTIALDGMARVADVRVRRSFDS